MKTVIVSGGFDPLHAGHLALFRFAKSITGHVTAVVEPDGWVARKHRVLLPAVQRAEILQGLRGVDDVRLNTDPNGDDSALLEELQPAAFVVGPDHDDGRFVERATCERLGIRVLVRPKDGTEDIHSSALVREQGMYRSPLPIVAAVVNRAVREDIYGSAMNKVLSVREVLLATRATDGKMEILGGFVEVGERLEDALGREVREESGCNALHPEFLGSVFGKYYDGRDVVVAAFGCGLHGEPRATEECTGFRWVRKLPPVNEFSHPLDHQILSIWGGLEE